MVFLGGAGWAAPRSFSPIPIVRRLEAIFRKQRLDFGGMAELRRYSSGVITTGKAPGTAGATVSV